MHDIKYIRSHPEAFDANLCKRGIEPCAQEILALDAKSRHLQTEIQELQEERNALAKQTAQCKDNLQEVQRLSAKSAELKSALPVKEQDLQEVQALLHKYLTELPNILAEDVPLGDSEVQNVLVRTWGDLKQIAAAQEHWQLGEALQQMDFSNSAKMSGSRFVILSGELAQLERALANFMLDVHTQEYGFTEISPPLLVHERAMFGAGQLPKFADDSFATTEGFRLIPTSEVPLVNIVADRIIAEEELPLRFTAHTHCFRSEAGSAGRDTRGMIRLHQFSKVELVSIVRPQDSAAEHERITNAAESILQKLELPYRLILLCTGDTGFHAHKTYDLEVWLPGQNAYREISSCSNCIDFQARRMKARYREYTSKQNAFLHTLNGSGLAVGRTLVAIMENYQNADGSIAIPTILQQYMKGRKVIGGK